MRGRRAEITLVQGRVTRWPHGMDVEHSGFEEKDTVLMGLEDVWD
jgi:hypothetical protein